METRANYVLIGSFTLAVIAAAFGFVLWFQSLHTTKLRSPDTEPSNTTRYVACAVLRPVFWNQKMKPNAPTMTASVNAPVAM